MTYNNAKKIFCEELTEQLFGKKLKTPIILKYTLFKKSKRMSDRNNVLSVMDKFFCDSLVNHLCIPDDNDEFIESQSFFTGGIDKDNPRVEVEIYEA